VRIVEADSSGFDHLPQHAWYAAAVRCPSSLLAWIIAFKAFKAITLMALGIALLATRHGDPVDLLMRGALAIHLPLTSTLFDRALRFALNLSMGKQIALGITAFGYAVLMGSEGVALYLRKPWARWFTIGATSSLLPIELYEIVRDVHLVRVIVLLANVAIVVYLLRRKALFEAAR
jgi:uncharacterized membrane protein (DUF2068 family)